MYEKGPKNRQLEDWVKLLYDQALIAEGRVVKDPVAYLQRVNKLLITVSEGEAAQGEDKKK